LGIQKHGDLSGKILVHPSVSQSPCPTQSGPSREHAQNHSYPLLTASWVDILVHPRPAVPSHVYHTVFRWQNSDVLYAYRWRAARTLPRLSVPSDRHQRNSPQTCQLINQRPWPSAAAFSS
jgi:hypothetical protein